MLFGAAILQLSNINTKLHSREQHNVNSRSLDPAAKIQNNHRISIEYNFCVFYTLNMTLGDFTGWVVTSYTTEQDNPKFWSTEIHSLES